MQTTRRQLVIGAAASLALPRFAHAQGLSDLSPMAPAVEGEEVVVAALQDAAAVHELLRDVQAVVHLGGISVEGPFEPILQANIVGAYNLYQRLGYY